MPIVRGYADKGGSLARQSGTLDRAKADLEEKLGGAKVTALATHEDDNGISIIASTEGPVASVPAESKKKKKGGK